MWKKRRQFFFCYGFVCLFVLISSLELFTQPCVRESSWQSGIQPQTKVLLCCWGTAELTSTGRCDSEAPLPWIFDIFGVVGTQELRLQCRHFKQNYGESKSEFEDSTSIIFKKISHFWRLWLSSSKSPGKYRALDQGRIGFSRCWFIPSFVWLIYVVVRGQVI